MNCHCHIGGTSVKTPYTMTVCGELICSKHEPEKLAMNNGKKEADCPDCKELSKKGKKK